MEKQLAKSKPKSLASKPSSPNSYIVKSKGYRESFSSLENARKQLEILKKRAIKNQEKVKIEIFSKANGIETLVDEVKIDEGFYSND
jgi:hypothetical protein